MRNLLLIGQDNLLAHRADLSVDFVPTGKAYTPDAPRHDGRSLLVKLPVVVKKFLGGEYDAAIVPAIDTKISYGDDITQKLVRRIIQTLLRINRISSYTQKLSSSRTTVMMLDRYDAPGIQHELANFAGASSYWKLNLHKDQQHYSAFSIHSLPCWVYPPDQFQFQSPLPWEARDIDLFCAFSVNSEAKRVALEWANRLPANNLKVFIASAPLTPTSFHEHMARSKIVLSPEGIGYHCFRHYQAMMHGAIPLVDRPTDIVTNLEHGVNSLLYDENENSFQATLLEALRDDVMAQSLANSSRKCWEDFHSPNAVGDRLIQYLFP